MKKLLFIFCLLSSLQTGFAQKWIDTLYGFQKTPDMAYGSAIDFAGNQRVLHLDLYEPVGDTIPSCGRPLLIAIHGGAFLGGSKSADAPPYWAKQFAQRGYVAASIQYRLGMFQTSSQVNCNVSLLGLPWNCLNMQDTAEWYRGAFRAMQDVKGAIRFLLNQASTYHIDPRNVFIVGESAGGFTALNVAFLDDPMEKPSPCGSLSNATPPNTIYENQCIQTTGYDTSIALMQLARPDLGSIDGDLNLSAPTYTIKGVGNFYGGVLSDLFSHSTYTQAPRLYLYHQPNDLVVPYQHQGIYHGGAYCFTQWPANCQWIINRPWVYGSSGIQQMISGLNGSVTALPLVYFDSTLNTADCATQLANPSLAGHAIDNIWLRTLHMAQFFAPAIDTSSLCGPSFVNDPYGQDAQLLIYPNPANGEQLHILSSRGLQSWKIYSLQGQAMREGTMDGKNATINIQGLVSGVYFIECVQNGKRTVAHFIR
ncbi:MAG: carboxylesterase family protein [Chitinophagaceae bacterium]|nr:carboxylesterase family protein [Chitinophagaceae bacterium]